MHGENMQTPCRKTSAGSQTQDLLPARQLRHHAAPMVTALAPFFPLSSLKKHPFPETAFYFHLMQGQPQSHLAQLSDMSQSRAWPRISRQIA
ncbi:hypothetical protein CHARACLAT_020715 [Characodon lateralis]|uniref:Uncharacterized protein n=1 Tax=Characodon lateralis TaxID=208331 RepID=A0ABU7DID4_9TELE|nr:hypothetical protein [Characodon lateralis]